MGHSRLSGICIIASIKVKNEGEGKRKGGSEAMREIASLAGPNVGHQILDYVNLRLPTQAASAAKLEALTANKLPY